MMLSSITALKPPINVTLVDCYADGTIWFSLNDTQGQFATLCIDGRVESQTRFRLFDRARHPNSEDARLIGLGEPEEGIVIPLISSWIDSGGLAEWNEYGAERFLYTFNRYGEPLLNRDS
jgi:hypothetical protein